MIDQPIQAAACPPCLSEGIEAFFRDAERTYLQCRNCRLVFVPEPFWLSPEDEKAVYDLHENDSRDTFEYIAWKANADLTFADKDVILLQSRESRDFDDRIP